MFQDGTSCWRRDRGVAGANQRIVSTWRVRAPLVKQWFMPSQHVEMRENWRHRGSLAVSIPTLAIFVVERFPGELRGTERLLHEIEGMPGKRRTICYLSCD
jgi:hypothetical protein